ncbi:hypothetical protein QQ020_21660 [Fulvivirgaceae bacterium BMA12]|uniref:Uncharacterized protein n=1 Tax=Agaribacillus aureus TaxID=3051825 RepID=A0ABT8LD76_9BACT|nr:hypothetical protein [Fulvivirgaceae bacterium BMA12]
MNQNERNLFDSIINKRRKNLFIFTFGATGMGKSSLLTYLFYQIKKRFGFEENLQDGYSSKLFQEYVQNFELNSKLPHETASLRSQALAGTPFQYVDVTIDSPKDRIDKTKITFLEFAGEDIESIDKGFNEILINYKAKLDEPSPESVPKTSTPKRGPLGVKSGKTPESIKKQETTKAKAVPPTNGYSPGEAVKFIKQLDDLLTNPDIYIMCFLVASVQYARVEDFLIGKFISLIKQNSKYVSKLVSANLIVTKWDLAMRPDEDIESFAKENLSNSFNLLSKVGENGTEFNLLPFSVGKIDPYDALHVKEPNMEYAVEILELITKTIKSEKPITSTTPIKKNNALKKNKKSWWKKYW